MSVAAAESEKTTRATMRWFEPLRLLLGGGLLVTATLKTHGLVLDPVSQESFFASPRLQVAVIEMEILLGLWLLSGWAKRVAWGCALGFFSVLAAASFYMAWEGQASCECFGQVKVNPWVTFIIDVAIVAGLAFCRPLPVDNRLTLTRQSVLKIGLAATCLLIITVALFCITIHNPLGAVTYLRGEYLSVEPLVADVGNGTTGKTCFYPINLTNNSNRSVRIVGGTTTCACMTTKDLPLTIRPSETRSIEIFVKFSGSTGRFHHRFVLLTDDEQQPVIIARFSGRVVGE